MTVAVPTFQVLVADPPWRYRDVCRAGQRGAAYNYPTMAIDDLKRLPVQAIAAKDAVLFLWATPPQLPAALEVMAAWGFRYKTVAFTWVKTSTHKLEPVPDLPGNYRRSFSWGMGSYTRANAEVVLLGVRGKGLKVASHGVHSVVLSPRLDHSQKPDEVQERIERLYPDASRVELFARRRRPGWGAMGNEVESDFMLTPGGEVIMPPTFGDFTGTR